MDCCYFGVGMAGAGLLLLLEGVWRPLLGWTVATSDVSMAAVAGMDCCYFGCEYGAPQRTLPTCRM